MYVTEWSYTSPSSFTFCAAYTRSQKIALHQVQALSGTMSAELATSGVSCVLSWHVLSEGQVHYQRGHTSLECVECRVCWAGTSCQKDKSTIYQRGHMSLECVECRVCWARTCCQKDGMSHRSVTAYSWPCTAVYDSPGRCSPLCWSSSVLGVFSTPNLSTRFTRLMLW